MKVRLSLSLLLRLVRQCPVRCCRRFVGQGQKLKSGEEDRPDADAKKASLSSVAPLDLEAALARHPQANGQDADEATLPVEVLSWQMPQLVVERAKPTGARIHKGTSLVLPEAGQALIAAIVTNLPLLQQVHPKWLLGYSMAVDGVSLRTLYRQVADKGPCLLVIEDSSGSIFGAYASDGLRYSNVCHGTMDSFLFRFSTAAGAWRTDVYRNIFQEGSALECLELEEAEDETLQQSKVAECKTLQRCKEAAATLPPGGVFCDYSGIVIGIDGPALFIDQDLLRGGSWASKSFGSPMLAGASPDFVVRNLEVWHW
mmetsp:Transcript_51657/g.122964  ORF Transcript_51657/g.122964 Transcript_51657/m.122964 type:complete len:314 (-) Transcript_51657:141-1082(-)